MSRFRDAYLIQQGACNPSGVARSLVSAIDEARAECADTDYVRRDPAVRLIAHQLAFLLGVAQYDNAVDGQSLYSDHLNLCRMVSTLTKAQLSTIRYRFESRGKDDPVSYPEFLSKVLPVLGTRDEEGHSAVSVPWCGMILCVEPDGYAHS